MNWFEQKCHELQIISVPNSRELISELLKLLALRFDEPKIAFLKPFGLCNAFF